MQFWCPESHFSVEENDIESSRVARTGQMTGLTSDTRREGRYDYCEWSRGRVKRRPGRSCLGRSFAGRRAWFNFESESVELIDSGYLL